MKLPSIYHLDTNIVIAYFNGNRTIANKLKFHLPQVSISTLVFGELLYGARASQRREPNLEKVYQLLRMVNLVDFNQASAEQYSRIRVSLRQKGRPKIHKEVTQFLLSLPTSQRTRIEVKLDLLQINPYHHPLLYCIASQSEL